MTKDTKKTPIEELNQDNQKIRTQPKQQKTLVKEHNQNHKNNSKCTQPKQGRTLVKKHDQA
jgi:hypothetical protein